ncbi:bifunctional 23S rRNA (guanine(2069)-N(7))-methyltransferase RlmK/23S rRNA (guanine(2445)-N(2))-methyltransferase RlmL [Botrimarina hoheduenensis]|uniref:Ribosomal RNA large subunit methyltransferase K/L n=1 Tax=Botrimarina hoheduenensis TaxID=2528000 RepID=A0A5C5WF44_9BACT|nr:bifunctional 23S rRNA (guanine(2069)-N(7))-methyltransferase RlmK/23S rRNA (guanine(2445)-N(2))-methyltransferase RlmL [Botrimarina hoheduenensis]TWT48683.1 Ribosomal RNA large subunit methyltransferase K/L [Botrimarina hoheduenensis]
MAQHELIATATFGLETLVRHEVQALGYEARVAQPGRVRFRGGDEAVRETNVWLRYAERVLIVVAEGPATDFGQLFDLARAAPVGDWVPADGAFPVRGRSHKSQLSSVPACQRIVKKALVEALREAHGVQELPETGPEFTFEIALLDDHALLLLDTTGIGLHKRGYRRLVGEAPLRETLAAAMVDLSRWTPDRPFWDPFCGSGTIAIEAALRGRNLAPGLNRWFACEAWPRLAGDAWRQLRDTARARAQPTLPERILATDISEEALSLARYHAQAAGVADDIHFQRRAFEDLSSKRDYGCLVTNPPYGERLGEREAIESLYRTMPGVLRRLRSWSHYLLSARDDFERLVGQRADKRRKLYNGRLECTLYQFHGPRPPRPGAIAASAEATPAIGPVAEEPAATAAPLPRAEAPPPEKPAQAFGGLRPEAERQAREFANRLAARARHLRRWPTKRGITCYRLYERDIPEVPLVVDRYEDALHLTEYERPHERTPAEHADWLDLMARTAAKTLEVDRSLVFLKRRERQRGDTQHTRVADERCYRIVNEGGLRFRVNLSDYVDTGLFLDHRITRDKVRQEAAGKRFLNLFAYTGSFTVYAAAGGALETTTVDLSANYLDWAEANLRLNGFQPSATHEIVRADCREFVAALPNEPLFDLAVVDPPTFSNSKRLDDDWETQRDAVPLLGALAPRMAPGGVVYFSTNFRRFHFDEGALAGYSVREISKQTVPEDFRNQRIHRCWRLMRET